MVSYSDSERGKRRCLVPARPAACCPNIRVQVKVVSGGSAWLSWRKRRLLQARRALVARPGAQLARGAAVYAPPLSVGPVAPRLVAVVSRIPSVTIGFLSVV